MDRDRAFIDRQSRLDNVRYLSGAPAGWEWLHPGDIVSLVDPGTGIAIESPSGRAFLPLKSLERIDIDPPRRHDSGVDWGKMTLGLMNWGALQSLPRRFFKTLHITADGQVFTFDVFHRTYPAEKLVTPEMRMTLKYAGESKILIKDGSHRFISMKHFAFATIPPKNPLDALAVLLEHPEYWDGYGSASNWPNDHGPYRRDTISIGSFQMCDPETALSILEEWFEEEVPSSQVQGNPSAVRDMIREADTRFLLPDLGENARHETAFILSEDFLEFVLLGPRDQLLLVVACAD